MKKTLHTIILLLALVPLAQAGYIRDHGRMGTFAVPGTGDISSDGSYYPTNGAYNQYFNYTYYSNFYSAVFEFKAGINSVNNLTEPNFQNVTVNQTCIDYAKNNSLPLTMVIQNRFGSIGGGTYSSSYSVGCAYGFSGALYYNAISSTLASSTVTTTNITYALLDYSTGNDGLALIDNNNNTGSICDRSTFWCTYGHESYNTNSFSQNAMFYEGYVLWRYMNNVSVRVYNASSLLPLNTSTITWYMTNANYQYNGSTSNGSFNVPDAEAGNYTIRLSRTGYGDWYKTVEVTVNTTTTNVSIYVYDTTSNVTFNIKDKSISTSVIADALVQQQVYINSTWTTVYSKYSDIVGTAIVPYSSGTYYRFVISKNGYNTKTFDLNPITADSYNILLEKSSSTQNTDYSGFSFVVDPQIFVNGANTTTTVSFVDAQSRLNGYSVTFNYPGGSTTVLGNNSAGSVLTAYVAPVGATVLDNVNATITIVRDSQTFTYVQTYPIQPSGASSFGVACTDGYGMGEVEKAIVGTVMVILLAALAYYYLGAVGGGAITIIGLYLAVKMCLFNPYVVAGGMIVGVAILLWRTI